jgi:hypothetical protein
LIFPTIGTDVIDRFNYQDNGRDETQYIKRIQKEFAANIDKIETNNA